MTGKTFTHTCEDIPYNRKLSAIAKMGNYGLIACWARIEAFVSSMLHTNRPGPNLISHSVIQRYRITWRTHPCFCPSTSRLCNAVGIGKYSSKCINGIMDPLQSLRVARLVPCHQPARCATALKHPTES